MKTLVIGIDGGTWKVFKKLIESGEMPTLKKLIEKGYACTLKSTIPPYTGIAWTAFASGRNPGKNGIFDFVKFEDKNYNLRVTNFRDIKCPTYFKILSKHNIKSIIINLPGAFPQKINNSIIVADFLSPTEEFLSIPKEIQYKYEDMFKKYQLIPKSEMFDYENYLNETLKIEKIRFEIAKTLFTNEPWEHFFYLFSGSDWASHSALKAYLYNNANTNNRIKEKFIKIFRHIDISINWFIKNMDKNTIMFLISDHGHVPRNYIFYINEWLCREGYGVKKPKKFVDPFLEKQAKQIKVKTVVMSPTLTKLIYRLSKTPLIHIMRKVYHTIRNITGIQLFYNLYSIDFEKSKAFCPSFSTLGIYINTKNRFKNGLLDTDEFNRLCDEIINKLRNLKISGQKIFRGVWKKEELYYGAFIQDAPDIILLPSDGIEIHIDTNVKSVLSHDEHLAGTHSIDGIFLAYGSCIKNYNSMKDSFSITDIAPTILFIHGIPIPKDMDGRVLKDIFREDSELYIRGVSYLEDSHKEKIRTKLSKLKQSLK